MARNAPALHDVEVRLLEEAARGLVSEVVEMQILGDEKDPTLYLSEQEKIESRRRMAQLLYEKKLDRISPDLKYAIGSMNSLKAAIEDLGASNPGKYDSAKYLAQFEQFSQLLRDDARRFGERILLAAQQCAEFDRDIFPDWFT